MKQSIILKTLLLLGSLIIIIFIGFGYSFSQNDKGLIDDIREYNLKTAMEALDYRQIEKLKTNQEQMENMVNTIAKNSSEFLLNYDYDGLKQNILFDMKKDSVKAIKIWDNEVDELFLIAIKNNGQITFNFTDFKESTKYKKIEKNIDFIENGKVENLGKIIFYYDETIIIKQINTLKKDTINKINKFNLAVDNELKKSNQVKLFISLGALILILLLISILLMQFVNKPLKILQKNLDDFFLFLQNKKETTSTISIDTNDEFGQMSESLNENIAVSARLHEEIQELNTNLENKIAEKTKKVITLLDNADQGFLTFGNDFIIDKEYSKECLKIFKQSIDGVNIANLLYPKASNKKDFFIQTLQSLLKETNTLKIKTIISLLQNEFIVNKKAINVQYKIIDEDKFMLILTDVTTKKILEKKINREKNILKMIVAIVSDSEEFFELSDEFSELELSKKTLIDTKKTPLHNATEIYRIIHTFKGLFSQKEMNNVVVNLHKLESILSEAISSQDNTNEKLQNLLNTSDFDKWLKKDIDIIKDILGEELFSKRGNLLIKEETISNIEKKIIEIAKNHENFPEIKVVADEIKDLKQKTVYSMFSSYPKLLDQLSERLEKSIYPLEIIVDKELKVNDKIKPFVKSLVHLFRNSIDHGIETMDERAEIEKDEIGTISCSIKKENENLHIIIADDGAGLNIDKIKSKASSIGISTDNMSDKEIEYLIFNDRFSTKEKVTQISGRGVGMAVVKDEVEKLNGIIKINSQINKGTTIEFVIPL